MQVIIAMIIFGIIVLVHEFGHYIAAVKNGVLVEEFAIGMGPKLYSFTKGETLFSIRLLPLGGMCRMLGEDEASPDSRSFNSKKVHQRIIIILAGVTMNIILAVVLQFVSTTLDTNRTAIVASVEKDSPAEKIGITAGDKIISYNNRKIRIFEEAFFAILDSGVNEVNIKFQKPTGEIISKNITPKYLEEEQRAIIGFLPVYKAGWLADKTHGDKALEYEKLSFGETFSFSLSQVAFKVKYVLYGLKQLITLNVSADDMMGPIGLVSTIGDTYEAGMKKGIMYTLLSLMDLTILLSANLAVFNILPLPALDGGRFIFLVLEGLRGKPVDPNKEGLFHLVGFVLLIAFSIFIAYNDAIRIITN